MPELGSREKPAPKAENPPKATERSAPPLGVPVLVADERGLLALQRAAGNSAVVAMIQRDLATARGHAPHPKKPHTVPELQQAKEAVKALLDEKVIAEASAQAGFPKPDIAKLEPGLARLKEHTKLLEGYDQMAKNPVAAGANAMLAQLKGQLGRRETMTSTIETAIKTAGQNAALAAVQGAQAAPLNRVEVAAAEVAAEAGVAVAATTPELAAAALARLNRAANACEEQRNLLRLRVEQSAEAGHTLAQKYIEAYLRSAEASLSAVARIKGLVEGHVKARREAAAAAVNLREGRDAKAAADAEFVAAQAEVRTTEDGVRTVEAAIDFERGYAEALLEVAIYSETASDGNPDFGPQARAELARRQAELAASLDAAKAKRDAGRARLATATAVAADATAAAAPGGPLEQAAAATAATVPASGLSATNEAGSLTSHLTTIGGLRTASEGHETGVDELRALAGGIGGLDALARACGIPTLRTMLAKPGPAEMRALLAGLGEASLTTVVAAYRDRFEELVRTARAVVIVPAAAPAPGGVGVAGLVALATLPGVPLATAVVAAGGVAQFGKVSADAGVKEAGKLLADPAIAAKVLALDATLDARLGQLITAAGVDHFQKAMTTMAADRVAALADPGAIGIDKLGALMDSFQAELAPLVAKHGDAGLKTILATFTAKELKASKLTKEQFDTLTTTPVPTATAPYTMAETHGMATKWKEGELAVAVNAAGLGATGAEVKAKLATLGTPTRVKELMETRKLTVAAIKTYKAEWLKTFIGAGNGAWGHLLSIHADGDGIIKGGHDREKFEDFTNRTYPGGTQKKYRVVPALTADPMQKVTYHALDATGHDRPNGTGSKTVYDDMDGRKDALLEEMNKAIWAAIAACTFPGQLPNDTYKGTADFVAGGFKGYYNAVMNGGKEVDTIFHA